MGCCIINGWQLNFTIVAQVILFTEGALLFWGNFLITKTHPTSKQDAVIYCLLPENEKNSLASDPFHARFVWLI